MDKSVTSAHQWTVKSIALYHTMLTLQYLTCFTKLELRTIIPSMEIREVRMILSSTSFGREISSHHSKGIYQVSKGSIRLCHHTMPMLKKLKRMFQSMTALMSSRGLKSLTKTISGTATSARPMCKPPRKLKFIRLLLFSSLVWKDLSKKSRAIGTMECSVGVEQDRRSMTKLTSLWRASTWANTLSERLMSQWSMTAMLYPTISVIWASVITQLSPRTLLTTSGTSLTTAVSDRLIKAIWSRQ